MKKLFIAVIFMAFSGLVVLADETPTIRDNSSGSNFNTNLNPAAYTFDAKSLKNSIVTVPAGQTFRGVFLSPVSSETAFNGQEVSLALTNDFYCKDKKVAPAGSTVTGSVIEVSKAKHGSLNGKLAMRFTHLITPSGLDIPISAVIRTPDKSGVLLGGSDLMFTFNNGTVPEAESAKTFTPPFIGVNVGTAAAMTTAVKTNGGSLLKSVWDKGVDVDISANTAVELILTQPITVTPTDN